MKQPCRRMPPSLAPFSSLAVQQTEKVQTMLSKSEETKELALQEGSTEVVMSREEEAKAFLDEASKGMQAILKFKEDHFHIRGEEVPLGTRYYAYPANWERQWIRFDDDKVTERIRVKVSTRKLLPARNRLSDPQLEDSDKDPWSLQNAVPFENVETGELATFTTSSVGGRMAIEEMVAAYSKAVLAGKARGLPIIELQIGSFKSGFKRDVPRPAFPIVDWENPGPAAASAKPTIIPPEPKKAKAVDVDDEFAPAEEPSSGDDMDDAIPF
jgi:hypothetical protein